MQNTNNTKQPRPTAFTTTTLSQMQDEPITFIVDGLIPTGYCLLGAPPKYGKSWFVFDLCLSVAHGTDFMGKKVLKGDSLYLALEDNSRRLKDRFDKLGHPPSDNCVIYTSLNGLDFETGLINWLDKFINHRPNTKLIVIDTVQKVRSVAKEGSSLYGQVYKELGKIQEWALENDICVIAITHTTKSKDEEDPYNSLMGSVAEMGVADAGYVMVKRGDRVSAGTKLYITGRDITSDALDIKFNEETFKWEFMGKPKPLQDPKLTQILNGVEQNNGTFIIKSTELGIDKRILESKYKPILEQHNIYHDRQKTNGDYYDNFAQVNN